VAVVRVATPPVTDFVVIEIEAVTALAGKTTNAPLPPESVCDCPTTLIDAFAKAIRVTLALAGPMRSSATSAAIVTSPITSVALSIAMRKYGPLGSVSRVPAKTWSTGVVRLFTWTENVPPTVPPRRACSSAVSATVPPNEPAMPAEVSSRLPKPWVRVAPSWVAGSPRNRYTSAIESRTTLVTTAGVAGSVVSVCSKVTTPRSDWPRTVREIGR
jgi:hypothetical protein